MKKNKKIVIAIIIFAVLILVVGIALAFVLKNNNKEEFFKYAGQIFDSENGFIDNRIEQYNSKKAVETFENKGKITVNVPTENLDSKTADEINNTFNISFAGNIDNANQMAEELIKINYDKENNFPILYKKSGDVQAVKLSKIVQKYLGMKNLNPLSFFDMGASSSSNSSSSINNKSNNEVIDKTNASVENDLDLTSNSELSSDENKKIIDKILDAIKNSIDEKSVTKVSTADLEGYSLEISYEKLKDIVDIIIDNLKTEEELLSKYNLNSSQLDFMKLYYIEQIPDQLKTVITVYKKDNKLNRIIIELDDYFKFDVKKVEIGEDLEYDININLNKDGNNIVAKLVLEFSGLNSLEIVTENHSLGIDYDGNSYTYNFENEVNFTDVEVKDFEKDEYVDINKLSQTNQMKLFQALITKFNKINNELIEKVGAKPDDFWSNFIPKSYSTSKSTNEFEDLDKDDEEDKDKNDSNKNSDLNTIGNTTTVAQNVNDSAKNVVESDNLSNSFSEAEKQAFNSKYLAYEGKNVGGSNVKTLLMQVIANNMADEERQIKVSGDVILTGNEVPDGIETSKKYSVEFKKSKDGYINEVIIKNVE